MLPMFFGESGTKKLKFSEFQVRLSCCCCLFLLLCLIVLSLQNFLQRLHDGILELEFRSYDDSSQGSIAASDFAMSIVRILLTSANRSLVLLFC